MNQKPLGQWNEEEGSILTFRLASPVASDRFDSLAKTIFSLARYIEITSWKARAYGIFTRVGEASEIERVSAANE